MIDNSNGVLFLFHIFVVPIEILLHIECSLGVSSHFGCKTSGAIIKCKNWCSIGIYLIFTLGLCDLILFIDF
jgi:hypothetical protein